MKRISAVLASVILLAGLTGTVWAKELRLAFVDSEQILEASDDYREARQKLQDEERRYVNQATSMEEVVRSMADELRAQSLMLSSEARTEREQRFLEKQRELEDFRKEIWGEGGKLFSRNLELSRPVLEKINGAIQKISQEYGYDFVFDAASANIVYALPEYDITERVIEQLKKE